MQLGILIEDFFDEQEFIYPFYRLQEAAFTPLVIGPEVRRYRSKAGFEVKAEVAATDIESDALAGLIIPGGYAPDRIRRHPAMLALVRGVNDAHKPIGAICHASWVIISAKIVKGRRVTGHPSTRDDLENAGALYQTARVVTDGKLVTAQHYRDLPEFMTAFLALF
jgi:protease I